MSESKLPLENPPEDPSGETALRGDALQGSEQSSAADHLQYLETRNPDVTLHLDNESDSLYTDGIEVGDGAGT